MGYNVYFLIFVAIIPVFYALSLPIDYCISLYYNRKKVDVFNEMSPTLIMMFSE